MLRYHFNRFLDYCRLADFSIRSIRTLTARTSEFEAFLKILKSGPLKRSRIAI